MKRLFLVAGVLVTGVLLIPGDADARRGGGGGGGRSFHRGGHGISAGRVGGVRHAGGYGARGAGYYGGRYGGRYGYGGRYVGRYPYRGGYYGGNYPYYGAGAAGLVTGSVLGAAAASTYYQNPYYQTPVTSYPAYETPASSAIGGYCATSVRTCTLIDSAPVGTGCSCRTQGGRARGSVVGG